MGLGWKKALALSTFACTSLGPLPSIGAAYSGATLRKLCAAQPSTKEFGACAGFVVAVSDMLEGSKIVCIPENTSISSKILVVWGNLNDKETSLSDPAAKIAMEAFIGSYPCPKKSKS